MKTNRRFSIAIAALALSFGAWPALAADAPPIDARFDPSKLVTPPLGRIPIVHPQRVTLANGIVVFLLEDHDLPVVTGVLDAPASPLLVPAAKAGLGRMMGEVIRSGGSAEHSGDWLDDHLASIGATITCGIDDDVAETEFHCLSENADDVISLFAEIVQKPAFPDDKIELSKVGMRRDIASRNDEMIPLLVRVSVESVYGPDSPFARKPEYATVEAIGREDCVDLQRKIFEPARMVIAVHGDFKTAEMKKLLTARFGKWKGAGIALPATPPPPALSAARLRFAPKDDVTQSGIIVAHVGFRADDPDYPAMDVLRTALGGGFQSRLVNRIRTERGLAYATGAQAGQGYLRPGLFIAYSLTKSESTMTALSLVREEVRKITEAPLSAEELKIAKESVENQFVFNFERPEQVLFRSAFFHLAGYPQDFLQRFQQGLEAVTAQTVLDAAKRKVHPDQMVAVVVGREKDFDHPLESAGLPVDHVDISIPAPPSKLAAAGEATPESKTKAEGWLKRAAELAGGTAAWVAIKSVVLEQSRTMSVQGQSISMTSTLSWVLPDRWLARQKLPMGEVKQGYDGAQGWMAGMGQIVDQPKVAEDVHEEYERSFFHLFGHPETVSLHALAEPRTADGVSYQVAVVSSTLLKDWVLYFAPDGRLARMEYQGAGPAGPGVLTEIYSDWKPEGQVQLPHSIQVLVDGKPLLDGKLTAAKLNPTLEDAVFKKPTQ